ncbi:class 3 adenylate cyclase [Deinobacterium chartae]|uniref:Class 3 adenylate cyclase n=1 Tax=Deinobacterium chartae TaxID=521158 RepID=A0A841I153_9DEIO|nr:adenylate/guanylate cyclase domain-containing protein [Deinobacterium chartae]MBB6098714.1 class 3 adenylate cyclase [Deinobacterium chartae]
MFARGAGPGAVRRDAAVLFVDLVDSTALAHRLELGDYAELMSEMLQILYLGLEAHGGTVLQHQGDALVAQYDIARLEACLRSAQDCHRRIASLSAAERLGERLTLRVGVACGQILSLTLGGQPTGYGRPFNLSRRLCTIAAPGETLVCADTYQLSPDLPATARPRSRRSRDFPLPVRPTRI